MSCRTPRPQRDKQLHVLVTTEELDALDRAADTEGISRSDVVRRGLRLATGFAPVAGGITREAT